MWVILFGSTVFAALAYAVLGKNTPDSVIARETPDPPPDPGDDEGEDEDEDDAPDDEDEDEDDATPDNSPDPDDYDDDAVYVNLDARRKSTRRARVPKIK